MSLLSIMQEPAIIIITSFFVCFVIYVIIGYTKLEKRLKSVVSFLQSLNKKELSYRFNQLDEYMSGNSSTATPWEDFKKALVFPDKIFGAAYGANNIGNSEYKTDIYLTVDASYFFNEETLVFSQINHKFIQIMPTLLTGLGPFFTFLNMAIAFTSVNFLSSNIDTSINELIAKIQIAALCSVFAVGYSLIFMFFERILYSNKCKKYYLLIQKELIRLFDICTSEQFLLDLVKEFKMQAITSEKVFKELPDNFAQATAKSLGEMTTPYLENILYSLNKLNETLNKDGGNGDMVDKLF